ncbi:MAG: hypothetical protein R2709_02660 [Marmoricola sp.]
MSWTWSEDDLAVKQAVRDFVDKQIRPRHDDLEHGDLPPYDVVREFYAAFGIADAAAEKFDWDIAAAEAKERGEEPPTEDPGGLDPAMSAMPISSWSR